MDGLYDALVTRAVTCEPDRAGREGGVPWPECLRVVAEDRGPRCVRRSQESSGEAHACRTVPRRGPLVRRRGDALVVGEAHVEEESADLAADAEGLRAMGSGASGTSEARRGGRRPGRSQLEPGGLTAEQFRGADARERELDGRLTSANGAHEVALRRPHNETQRMDDVLCSLLACVAVARAAPTAPRTAPGTRRREPPRRPRSARTTGRARGRGSCRATDATPGSGCSAGCDPPARGTAQGARGSAAEGSDAAWWAVASRRAPCRDRAWVAGGGPLRAPTTNPGVDRCRRRPVGEPPSALRGRGAPSALSPGCRRRGVAWRASRR